MFKLRLHVYLLVRRKLLVADEDDKAIAKAIDCWCWFKKLKWYLCFGLLSIISSLRFAFYS